MNQTPLLRISDHISEAHMQIQRDFKDIDPLVGVSHGMRTVGIPADLVTIDCLKTDKRIILLLHDEQPEVVNFQFSRRDCDPGNDFDSIALQDTTTQQLYDWIKDYFSRN